MLYMWSVTYGVMQAIEVVMKPEFLMLLFGMWLVTNGYMQAFKMMYCWILYKYIIAVACDTWSDARF